MRVARSLHARLLLCIINYYFNMFIWNCTFRCCCCFVSFQWAISSVQLCDRGNGTIKFAACGFYYSVLQNLITESCKCGKFIKKSNRKYHTLFARPSTEEAKWNREEIKTRNERSYFYCCSMVCSRPFH